MLKVSSLSIAICWLLLISIRVQAAPTEATIQAFVEASERARQPDMTDQDLEAFLAYLSDELVDFHAAYGRTFNGKDHLRNGIPRKAEAMKSLSFAVEDVVLGRQTAVFVLHETSEYLRDGELKQFTGRTIMLLEFDNDGLISHMRRYLD